MRTLSQILLMLKLATKTAKLFLDIAIYSMYITKTQHVTEHNKNPHTRVTAVTHFSTQVKVIQNHFDALFL